MKKEELWKELNEFDAAWQVKKAEIKALCAKWKAARKDDTLTIPERLQLQENVIRGVAEYTMKSPATIRNWLRSDGLKAFMAALD